MPLHRAAFGLAAALAVAASQAALSFDERPVRSLLEARHQNVVIQEWDSSCGAAALATILRFQLGDVVTERTVALGMLRKTQADRVRHRGGFSLLDMKRYAESRGFMAEGYAGLRAGQLMRLAPAIVPIRSYGGDHFVVFRGVVKGQAILADPAFGNRTVPYSVFESRWKDGLAFVVSRKGRSGNRLFATQRDLLRVDDDAALRGLDEALPRPLTEAQLALVFGAEPLAPPELNPVAGDGSPGARIAPPSRADVPGSIASSSGTSSTTGGATPLLPPATSTPALVPSATVGSGSVTIAAPLLPPIQVSTPPLPPITLPPPALPSVSIPLGR